MRVLVTGGSGFTGRFVLVELARKGHDVVALARTPEAASKVEAAAAEALAGDLGRPDELRKVFAAAKADALVNLASLGFGHAPAIVAAAEAAGLRRAVFVSTTAIFTTLPAPSKAVRTEAERVVEASRLQWTVVRPTMIYGAPGDRNIERLLRLLRSTPAVPLPGGGRGLIQPVQVADLAWFIVTAMEADTARRSLNVAGPEPLTLRDAVTESARAVGRDPRLLSIPMAPVCAGVSLYSRISARPRITPEQVQRLQEDKAFATTDATELGYRPQSFAEGVRREASALGYRP